MLYLSWANVQKKEPDLDESQYSHTVMTFFSRNLRQLFPKAVGHYVTGGNVYYLRQND